MQILIHYSCNSKSPFFNPSVTLVNHSTSAAIFPLAIPPRTYSNSCKSLCFSCKISKFRRTVVPLCTENRAFEEFKDTLLPKSSENDEAEELELLNKPLPKQATNGSVVEIEETELKKPDKEEILEPFYKFMKPIEEENGLEGGNQSSIEEEQDNGNKEVSVEYYEPKPRDLVVGVVVSGGENKLDVNVGADMLGTMLTKEVLPFSDKEIDHLLFDVENDAEEFLGRGKVGIVRNDEAMHVGPMQGQPVVEPGTVLFAEVLGRTLSGRPLLSSRRLFRHIAWHRVRQIKQFNEPIEVKITEWNIGGLVTRIEGLRAFIPKAELVNRVPGYKKMKENVGRRMHVQITKINQATNDLRLSEKSAWEFMHLQEGTLLKGTVRKIFAYGAQISIGDSTRSGLLHISNITRERISSVSDLLTVGEEVKVLVVKSEINSGISLSIAELESEPGLFLSNKEKVFSEAEEMAKKYRGKLPFVSTTRKLETLATDGLPFEDEERLYSNWEWFKFERDSDINT